jgi:FlaA1/EpsC-like NDP-sugar epimerase
MITLLKRYRVLTLIVAHLGIFSAIYFLAFLLRFDFAIAPDRFERFRASLPIVLTLKMLIFFGLRNFHGWWRHVTFSDFVLLLRASFASLIAIYLVDYLLLTSLHIPRSIVAIDCIASVLILGALRSTWRFFDETLQPRESKRKLARVLLIGSDFETAKFAHSINSNRSWSLNVVGLVGLEGTRKYNVGQMMVVGGLDDLPRLAKEYRAKIVIANTEKVSAKRLRQLIDQSRDTDYAVRVISRISEHLLGQQRLPVRDISVEDLLRRTPTKLDETAIEGLVRGKRILVTGAGGSIGSELCRQLAKFKPAELVLLGRGENRIFQIERELRRDYPRLSISPWIGSVTDSHRMQQLFEDCKPQVVYHAAAHKHVPLTECNVGEAVLNNVGGTQVVADLALEYAVEEFVLVSTDKAVNPTSVMGCTKQLADRYCLALGSGVNNTKFVVTRFGNVLGSSGSVVPVFQEQIRAGGPITITDERMTRFFMTIPEAAQLVVQASAMGQGGEIFVLDMGEQVKIVDMAKDMIRLAGLGPDDIEIVYSGIRPGEKLYEELYYDEEESLPTTHEKLLTAYHRPFELEETKQVTAQLLAIAYHADDEIRQFLRNTIPEYHSALDVNSQSANPTSAVKA